MQDTYPTDDQFAYCTATDEADEQQDKWELAVGDWTPNICKLVNETTERP